MDLVAATVDASHGIVHHAILGEDFAIAALRRAGSFSPKTSQGLRSARSICCSGEHRRRVKGDRLSVLFCFACGFTQGDLRTASRAMPWTSRRLLTSSPPA